MIVMAKKKNVGMAFLAVFLGLIGVVIALVTSKDDKYVMYYAKQSLALSIAWFVLAITIIGWLALPVVFVLMIIAVVNSLSGKEKKLPLLQWLADKFDF